MFDLGRAKNDLARLSLVAWSDLDWRAVAGVNGLDQFLPVRVDAALYNSRATIPAQDRVVVAVRPNRFCSGKESQRFFEQWCNSMWGAARSELGFRLPFMKNSRVVELLVLVPQA